MLPIKYTPYITVQVNDVVEDPGSLVTLAEDRNKFSGLRLQARQPPPSVEFASIYSITSAPVRAYSKQPWTTHSGSQCNRDMRVGNTLSTRN